MKAGHSDNYYWYETSSEKKSISDFISDFSTFILGKNLAIISFDSGPLSPTEEEIKRGWVEKNEIAYFNNINEEELKGPIFDNYDQWFFFDDPTEINDIDFFVNYTGFSLDADAAWLTSSVTNKFWETIKRVKPSRFLLCGEKFIYGSVSELEIKEMEKVWCS